MTIAATQSVLQEITAIFETTLRLSAGKLDVHANFEDFGIDSIISMELINKISKKYNITLPPSKFVNVKNIRELADLLEEIINENKEEETLPAEIKTAAPVKNKPEERPAGVKRAAPVKVPASRRPERRPASDAYQGLLRYISNKYDIDLSHHSFSSVDEIVDTLLTDYADDLMYYYEDRQLQEENGMNGNAEHMAATEVPAARATGDMAIVGISCNFPDAPDAATFWDNLLKEKNSIREIPATRWKPEDYYVTTPTPGGTISKWGALLNSVDCFDAGFFKVDPEEARLMDPQERLLIQEVYKAFQDAGIAPGSLAGSDTGVYVAYEYAEYENYLRRNIGKIPVGRYGPVFTSSSPTYYLANRLSFLLDFYGPSESINVNCAGSAVALHRAYYALLNQESSLAVVGGVSLNLFADDYISLSQYGMLSPDGTCGVFDDNANGFTRGEGVAAVVLKRLEDAERDHNRIYGVIKASHQRNRGNARFLSEVKHESITGVITDCYEKADIDLSSISYIEVDGYATKWGDSFEFEGVKNVFKGKSSKEKTCALGSVKGNIGNLESVSGLASFIKLSLSLYHKKFPATISGKTINSFLDIDSRSHPLYIAGKELSFDTLRRNDMPVRAGLNSFADSGVNLHIVLEEYLHEVPSPETAAVAIPQLFVLSAKDSERLQEYVRIYTAYLSDTPMEQSFHDLIYTLQTGRDAMEERLAIIAASRAELLEKLTMVAQAGTGAGMEKKGIFHGNINLSKGNPIADILTKDMISMMVRQSLQAQQWQQIAQLWITGLPVDWAIIWKNKTVKPLTLPAYPFARERHWVEIADAEMPAIAAAVPIAQQAKKDTGAQAVWFFFMSATSDNISTLPAAVLELFLKQEIALQLDRPLEDIPTDVNFPELGMNSIGLIALIARINELLQINISPAILFNCPEIKTLQDYLLEHYADKVKNVMVTSDKTEADKARGQQETTATPVAARILCPMQVKGDKRAVFAVPGADGNAITLQHLITALGTKQPFYGLESVGLVGDDMPLNSVTAIAQANIDAIREIQATGPYRLLGFSNGGTIAYEMARLLLEQQEKVESLILVDCMSPATPGGAMIDDLVAAIKAIFISSSGRQIALDAEQLKQVPENEIADYLYDNIKSLGFNFPKAQLATSINTTIANEKYCRAYKPEKLPAGIEVLLFKATESYIAAYQQASADYGWNELLPKPAQIVAIEANHFTLIDKDNSKKLAKKINTFFSKTSS
ncbi:beta-ketoacyl synthase N-terminal-like domain-containing protein [Chitinophaga varians]|uniref:beta-ketoacyl synthase N-terminal-like domain-containing protein n=1 Tax=Chitinophaga varians TaxID=2202339 RepID=UPI00165F37B2|nr:beta-ketoacyl synthase N-terminal-like domain-containing protein [Chitinophaga varians]MBC9915641.1 hypothetical protein [Chitinophaga varians]